MVGVPTSHGRVPQVGLDLDWLVIVEIRLNPPPYRVGISRITEEEKSKRADIRRIRVIQRELHLLLGSSEREEAQEEAEGRRRCFRPCFMEERYR